MLIRKDQRPLVGGKSSPDQCAAHIGHDRHRVDAIAGIVIAGNHHHRGRGVQRDAPDEIVELTDGTGRRCGSVEDVARNDQDVRLMRRHRDQDLLENLGVIAFERPTVEQPPQMQIRNVENFHARPIYV